MEPYSRYLEDKYFIDWVCSPTPESNAFWESYVNENPKEKEIVHTLKNVLLNLKTEDAFISVEEKQEILERILDRTSHTQIRRLNRYSPVKKYYKYAAILIIVITSGVFVNNSIGSREALPFSDVNITAHDSIINTQLTFATGEQLLIEEEKSTIEYNHLGNIIVNQNDTINNSIANNEDEVESLNTLMIPYGRRSRITLSDGTIAHLNAGTQFVFPDKFIGAKRTVFLSGEAFFEVAHNNKRPFIVKTIEEQIAIEVLGTKFNVSAYPSDHEVLTVLTEGKVNVVEHNIFRDKRTLLKPGELASWHKGDESLDVKEVNTDHHTLWIQGLLHFESEPIVNVIKKLERFYNIRVAFGELTDEVTDTSISGKLDLNDDIEITLENLMITTGFNFETNNNKNYMIN